ncbi:hypothetical protein FRC07_009913, partial [Ceratobasidium sp. 392]
MSRVPAALAYLVIYNPTLQPNPEDSTEGRDEDDVTEQAHILFYTARERAVSRDRILRQVGLAKALANFAEMFTSQPGFDNVHSQKSRLVMVSPEPNFWIHACVNLAKTPKATATKSGPNTDASEDFDYHTNSLNDDILRTQLMQTFQAFKLQYGGFSQIMQSDGVRALERRIESFFTPWAWQWNLGTTPEFGAYLGLPIHPLKKQLSPHINEYVSHVSSTPTLILSPPHIITASTLTPISPLPPLARFLEHFVPPPKPKPPLPTPPPANQSGTSTPIHMLAASGNAVTKYITKPAAQVVDPRNWSWPTYMTFGKGSMRSKDKEKSTIPAIDTNIEGVPNTTTDETPPQDNKRKELLGVPADQDTISRASRSVSPSTIDHESLLEAQQDSRLDVSEGNVDVVLNLALSTPLPEDSDSDSSPTRDSEVAEHVMATPRATVKEPLPESPPGEEIDSHAIDKPQPDPADHRSDAPEGTGQQLTQGQSSSDSPRSISLPIANPEIGTENIVAPPAAPEIAPVQVEISTRITPETTSGSVNLWLDSASEENGGSDPVTQKQKVTWIAIPGMLVASVVNEDHEDTWRSAAQELLFSSYETIQSRQLTAAETTLRALNTTKVIAHYPPSQMSASSVLPHFTSDSPHLFVSARALQFSTAPTVREIVTQTRTGTWCAARQSTPGTRLYVEIGRKEANLVDVDQELG